MSDGVPFGNYRLQRRLARGGMAEVFLARLIGVEGFERRVAIKRILPHLSESEEFRAMFLDEARLAAQLTHPNIVHIYDFGKVDDYYFIAMEYVDGVDIGRLIRRAKERPVPFELAARILADVCAGLQFAHNAVDPIGRKLDVVHRDVTPQNVLVSYDGIVKLVDFGIAKAQFAAGRTRPGVVKGKYAYMSPEQVEGKPLDGRSDVFSAGICLYEMLTGVPLFRRDDVVASMREIRDGKPIHPEKHRRDVPDELVNIMRRALQTSRDNRYASASAMQTDLEKYLKGATALATSRELAEYIGRELPPTLEESAPSTSAQPAGTQRQAQKQRTEVQVSARPPTPTPMRVPLEPMSMERLPMEPLPMVDSEKIPTTPDGEARMPAMPSDMHLADEPPTNERLLPEARSVKSGHTAVVPPLAQSPLRAYVAALVAGLTVAGVTLLALRPWAAAKDPVFVEVPAPPPPIVEEKPSPSPSEFAPHMMINPPVVVAQSAPAPTLDILSRPPGAHVIVDGEALRAVTPIHAEQFASGMHKVIVEKRGYTQRELAVQLGDGEHRTLDVELRPGARRVVRVVQPKTPQGFLTVRTVPWSKVFEGARLLGTTPMANVPLGEGAHTLTFVNPELPPVKRTVTMRAGEEERLSIELKK
ncbi:MAG TPA: protein kinase [Polyangia bacterium]|jgi:serine/threonine-protein kinase